MCEPPRPPPPAAAAGGRRLLRVTLLSLEGRRLPRGGPGRGSSPLRDDRASVVVAAWAGFRTTFPAGAARVPSSQFRALFDGEGGMLAVESAGMEPRCGGGNGDEGEGFAMCWRREGPGASDMDERIPTRGGEGVVAAHHLEIELPTSSPPPPERQPESNGARLPDVIEIHLCIVSTSCADDGDSEENDGDEHNFDEHGDNSLGVDRRAYCGIAHLKVMDAATTGPEYSRPGGKLETLPVRLKRPRDDCNAFYGSTCFGGDVALSENATLSIRVEVACIPIIGQHKSMEQVHYVESEWGGGKSAPASVVYRGSKSKDSACADCEEYNSTGAVDGLRRLMQRVASTLTLMASANPAQRPLENEKREDMVGRIVEVDASRSEGIYGTARSATLRNDMLDQTRTFDRKDTSGTGKSGASNVGSLATFSERFLCGASLGGVGDALRMAAAAGHHCDEDHVGLYVADFDEAGSSIATADVVGF